MGSMYEVFELIGEGSFGKVYRSKCSQTNSQVAYKVISKNGRSENDVQALREECEIQKYLSHKNIIRMLHSFENDDEIVIVTEFAHKDLCHMLRELKKLEEFTARKIICDLINALYYLHSNRILHRDLKPQNVLVDAEGNAKLCDFGLAKVLWKDSQKVMSIKGTPLYMAPELINQLPYDHNADLWSLGCISYEIVTGDPPYTTKSICQLMEMIKVQPIKWPTFLSDACLYFLKGLLEKNPMNRLSWPHLLYHPFINSTTHAYLSANITHQPQHPASSIYPNNISYFTPPAIPLSSNLIYKEMLPEFQPPIHKAFEKFTTCNNQLNNEVNPSSIDPTVLAQKEEWLDCLRKTIASVMYYGDVDELTEKHSLKLVMNTFNNYSKCPVIATTVARLLSLPFVVEHVPDTQLSLIREMYHSCNIVRDLLFTVKEIILRSQEKVLDQNEEVALQQLLLLICYLIFTNHALLQQFFKNCLSLNLFKVMKIFLSIRTKIDPLSVVKYAISIFLRLYILVPQSRKFVFQAFNDCTSEFHSLLQECEDINVHKELCTFITVLSCTERNFLRKSPDIGLLIKDISKLKLIAGTQSSQQSASGTLDVLKELERL